MTPRTQRHQPVRYTRGAGMMGDAFVDKVSSLILAVEAASQPHCPKAAQKEALLQALELRELIEVRERDLMIKATGSAKRSSKEAD